MMKKLVIYYSLTGNTDKIAQELSLKGYETRRVYEKKKMPKSFFWMVFIGGFRAGMHLKGKLINYDNDVSKYDEVVIISPIWNGLTPPAINSVLKQTDLSNKKLIFIFSAGSGEAPKMTSKINKRYPGSEVIVLKDPKRYTDEMKKVANL